jgi:hypothetical protein
MNQAHPHGNETNFWENWTAVENYSFWWTENETTFHGHLL